MGKIRVLAILGEYPTLSQTYKENELRAMLPYCEVRVLTFSSSHAPYRDHMTFAHVETYEQLGQEIAAFRPDVIHGHYLHTTNVLAAAAEMAGRPFTVRTHSFDLVGQPIDGLRQWTEFVNRSSCIGVLCFPFLRDHLVAAGVDERKIVQCWPVIDYARFYDRSPNGEEVINTGACIPKKNMESFIELAALVPQRRFNLYPIGYLSEQIADYNQARGAPVAVHATVEPHEMPRIYKQQQWLVYSVNPEVPTVGWPMAIAEAQAAGVGIAVQRIRPDMETYIGGAGYIFDTLEEAAQIVASSYPDEMREIGFNQAKRSDVREHIRVLTDLWSTGTVD